MSVAAKGRKACLEMTGDECLLTKEGLRENPEGVARHLAVHVKRTIDAAWRVLPERARATFVSEVQVFLNTYKE